jgi:hypothetical protein
MTGRGDEAELFRRHHHTLVGQVERRLGVPRELAEDACLLAWLQELAELAVCALQAGDPVERLRAVDRARARPLRTSSSSGSSRCSPTSAAKRPTARP